MTKTVRACPRCLSTDVKIDSKDFLSITGIDPVYRCKNCGYITKNLLRVDADRIEELSKEHEQEDGETYDKVPERETNIKRVALWSLVTLLGFGSLPYLAKSIEGLLGSFLILIGATMLYRELKY